MQHLTFGITLICRMSFKSVGAQAHGEEDDNASCFQVVFHLINIIGND